MPRIALRRATVRDLGVLVRHRRGMWTDMGEFRADALDAADAVYRRWARTRLRSGRLVAFVVERGGRPVASGAVWLMPVQPNPENPRRLRPYLLSMYTEPDERGRGHASRIVRAALRWARAAGHSTLALHASAAGRPVYERFGFERTWEMRKPLRPVPHGP